METRSTQSPELEQQEMPFFLFVVVVGYIITFTVGTNGGEQYSVSRLLIGIGCGAIYLVLGFFEAEILQRFSLGVRNLVYFSLQIILVFGIGWVLGPGGSWLIGLPMAGIAVEKLSTRARWPVYAGLLAAIILPILRYSTWDTALMNTLVISTAMLFVALFTQFRLNERKARQRAEELANQLESANRKLAEYATRVEELAAMQERNRLAREIHDNLGHYLTIANVQIEAAKIILDTDSRQTLGALDKAQDFVKKALASVRESVSALRVSPIENRPVQDAIASLIEEMWLSECNVEWKVLGEPVPVDGKIALALYRAAQEGLTNVRKHANATLVDVLLDFLQPDQLQLTIWDNGVGAADTSGGFGLIGIRERVHLLGGECRIESQPGKGFRLEVSLPLREGERV
jgi:signal transduction histidine kinase